MDKFADQEVRDFLKKIEDKVDIVTRRKQIEVTDFIDPYLCKIGENFLKNNAYVNYLSYGGADECERKRIVISPEFIDIDPHMFKISIVEYQGNLEFITAGHRDFLGALLSLGIKREKVGDIYPNDEGCVVIIDEDLADYILINAPKVKSVPLVGKKLPLGSFKPPQEEKQERIVNIRSLRVDTIVANAFGMSRSKAADEIKKGKVKVNWRKTENIASICQVEDVISFRGKGRVILDEIIGQTNKGRIKAKIKRFQ